MKYDFETYIDQRGTGSSKWQEMHKKCEDVPEGIVPLSVADMEFKPAPEIIAGLKGYLDTHSLGYTGATNAYYEAVVGWMRERHNWSIEKDWITTAPGIVFALGICIRAFTQSGDGVMIMTPVYYPFYLVVQHLGRKLVENPLKEEECAFRIDFEDLEKKAADPNNKLLLLCSPHNPVGRVWTETELKRIGEICEKHGVLVVSDEIHNDLIMPGYTHTVFATLGERFAENSVICTAPSKTFNLAGMQTSNIIIKNETLRKRFKQERLKSGVMELNALGYQACEIAYTKAEKWLDELIQVIDQNRKITEEFVAEHLKKACVARLEGTYLQWIDLRAYGIECKELEKIMIQSHLFLDEGYIFGDEGEGFERINIACPSYVLKEALERLKKALEPYV